MYVFTQSTLTLPSWEQFKKGYDIVMSYCNILRKTLFIPAVYLYPYALDATAMPTYTTSVDLTTTKDSFVLISCAAECQHLKSDMTDVTSCNSFYMTGKVCNLGYIDPSIVVDFAAGAAVKDSTIYVDFPDPLP